jgi:hypothetical protein
MSRKLAALALACLAGPISAACAQPQSFTVTNPTDETYASEPVRLKMDLPDDARPGEYVVKTGGREVPSHIEAIEGRTWIWVIVSLKPGQEQTFTVEKGKPKAFQPAVTVRKDGDTWVMDNGQVAIRLPASVEGGNAPGPVAGVKVGGGKWLGRSFWSTDRKFEKLTTTVLADGSAFGKIRLRYEFAGKAGVWKDTPSFAQIDVRLAPDRSHAVITESHEMDVDDYWEFQATHGWDARKALSQIHSGGAGRAKNPAMWPDDLKPLGFELEDLHRRYEQADPRVGNTLMWLLPRWSQAYEDGWFFAATDGQTAIGTLVARAGKWYWPHVNRIEIRAKPSADYAGFRCPTWKGRRMWLLTAGDHDDFADVVGTDRRGRRRVTSRPVAAYAYRYCFRPLDKILHDYVTTWPGEEGVFYPSSINPMNFWRGWVAGNNRRFPSPKSKLQQLCLYQVLIDPDMYGRYRLFWSPENPNFYTDFMRHPLKMLGRFKGHPQYQRLAASAKEVRWEDRFWSITQPSGAGQECPGYFAYAHGINEFHYKTAWPLGDGRRGMHPGGDTHPPYIFDGKIKPTGREKKYTSEDIEGFGVVLRNRPGTDRETYFALKSGPNRMHYHGDQLSFHYAANATPLAVDHHCSYIRRAGQEHMHNRVAFATDDMPFANMDGYERTIAFKTSDLVDVTVGEVSSDRLRYVREYPPEDWDREWPQVALKPELRYRRTVVMVKADPQDFFVIRDQYAGPDLRAAYCLHVHAQKLTRNENTFDFGGGLELFVAAPNKYKVARHDWVHNVGQVESTVGLRLETSGKSGEFITVLYPGKPRKVDRMTLRLPAAVAQEAWDRRKKENVLKEYPMTVLLDFAGGKLLEGTGVEVGGRFSREGHVATASMNGDTLTLDVKLNAYARSGSTEATYEIKLDRDGEKVAGSFTGRCGKRIRKGELTGTIARNVYSQLGRYAGVDAPDTEAIEGGVKVGDYRVTFAGGIDDVDGTIYVRVTGGDKQLLTVTGEDVDMDRSQGRIGLIVPDTGYPFGRIPDWLIRQRLPKGGYSPPERR